jgi:hypothetical protein
MRSLCFVVLTALGAPALGQDAEAAPVPQIAGADEVIVRGRTGDRMRIELERVENAFYERFNALNSRDEFDIVCLNEAPAGSHMPVRECLPEFALTAERRAAQETLRAMQGIGGGSSNTQIHFMRLEQKGAELIEEMQRLAREDEQLMRELTRLAELKQAVGGRVGKRR